MLRLKASWFTETESKKLYPKGMPSSAPFPVCTKWLEYFGPHLVKAPNPSDSNRLCWLLIKHQTWPVQDMTQWALLRNLMKESPGFLQLEKHGPKNLFSQFPCHAFQDRAFLVVVYLYLQAKKRSLILDFSKQLFNFTLSHLPSYIYKYSKLYLKNNRESLNLSSIILSYL